MNNPILERLKAIAPSACFSISREIDENFVWDGGGPDPIDEGYDACDVTVAAKAIVNGMEIEGCDYLGGSYFKPVEPCGDIGGYLPQMLAEAAEELEKQLGEHGLLNAELAAQLHNAIATIQGEMKARYDKHERRAVRIIGYCYEADCHCVDCAQKRFIYLAMAPASAAVKFDEHGLLVEQIDNEGNPIHPMFSTDEFAGSQFCGDCHERIE